MYDKHRRHLGIDVLRPWDLSYDSNSQEPLRPFENANDLEDKLEALFFRIDQRLGKYFELMRRENLMDLGSRNNKYPFSYTETLYASQRPFIFYNCSGTQNDVMRVIHESGHAFHILEMAHLPYLKQKIVPMEFGEVASKAMELIASEYLDEFYDKDDIKRARLEILREILTVWPYVAMITKYQHWIYTNDEKAIDPDVCDEIWFALWSRFMKGVDYSGVEQAIQNRWRSTYQLFFFPFYYIEYAIAQMASIQIWQNFSKNRSYAIKQFREALSLGYTKPLPELFTTAGAQLSFDNDTLEKAVRKVEAVITELEAE
jgi:oligoendopeptidase F